MNKDIDIEIKKISKNKRNGGYYTFFKYKDKYYFADIANTFDCRNECMIFSADENKNVTDWNHLYCNRKVNITENSLILCIKDFCYNLDKNNNINNTLGENND